MSTDLAHPTPAAGDLAARMRYAEALAGAGLLPPAYRKRPADVLLAVELGDALGLPTAVVLTSVYVVDGKPTMSAQLMASLARRAGHRLRTRTEHDDAGRPAVTAELRRADDPEWPFTSRWDLDRADRAGLLRKGPWTAYPEAMLRARATAEVIREACPEVLVGAYLPDELGHPDPAPDVVTVERVDTATGELLAEADDVAEGEVLDVEEAVEVMRRHPAAPPRESDPLPSGRPRRRPDGRDHATVTDAQLRKLGAAMREAGLVDRDDRLSYVAEVLGRPVTSSRDLSKREASAVIDALAAGDRLDPARLSRTGTAPAGPWEAQEPPTAEEAPGATSTGEAPEDDPWSLGDREVPASFADAMRTPPVRPRLSTDPAPATAPVCDTCEEPLAEADRLAGVTTCLGCELDADAARTADDLADPDAALEPPEVTP